MRRRNQARTDLDDQRMERRTICTDVDGIDRSMRRTDDCKKHVGGSSSLLGREREEETREVKSVKPAEPGVDAQYIASD